MLKVDKFVISQEIFPEAINAKWYIVYVNKVIVYIRSVKKVIYKKIRAIRCDIGRIIKIIF